MGIKWISVGLCGMLLWGCTGAEKPTPPADTSDQVFARDGDYVAAHILVAYAGATGAEETVTRSREEAHARAVELLGTVLAEPARFEALAREHSDGSSAERGGALGAWKAGAFVPEFEAAVQDMLVGQILDHVVESPFGFHIIRRDPLEILHYGADGFVISFKGHPENPPTVHRTREEAEALARSLAGKVRTDSFDAMAAQYNDLGEGPRSMGVVTADDPWPPEALALLDGLGYGQVGGPVAFPMGYVFLRRTKVVRYAGSVILVAWAGADKAGRTVVRTKEEALARARELIGQLQETPDQFAELASSQSDSPRAARAGDMGTVFNGTMEPEFRAAFEALPEGGMTREPVATRFGYYIIERHAVP